MSFYVYWSVLQLTRQIRAAYGPMGQARDLQKANEEQRVLECRHRKHREDYMP